MDSIILIVVVLGVCGFIGFVVWSLIKWLKTKRAMAAAANPQDGDIIEPPPAAKEPAEEGAEDEKEEKRPMGLQHPDAHKPGRVIHAAPHESTEGRVSLAGVSSLTKRSATEEMNFMKEGLLSGEVDDAKLHAFYLQLLETGFLTTKDRDRVLAEERRLAASMGEGELPSGKEPGKQGLQRVKTHDEDDRTVPKRRGAPSNLVESDVPENGRDSELPEEEREQLGATGGLGSITHDTGKQPAAKPGEKLPTTRRPEMYHDDEFVDLDAPDPEQEAAALKEALDALLAAGIDPEGRTIAFNPMTGERLVPEEPTSEPADGSTTTMLREAGDTLQDQGVQLGAGSGGLINFSLESDEPPSGNAPPSAQGGDDDFDWEAALGQDPSAAQVGTAPDEEPQSNDAPEENADAPEPSGEGVPAGASVTLKGTKAQEEKPGTQLLSGAQAWLKGRGN